MDLALIQFHTSCYGSIAKACAKYFQDSTIRKSRRNMFILKYCQLTHMEGHKKTVIYAIIAVSVLCLIIYLMQTNKSIQTLNLQDSQDSLPQLSITGIPTPLVIAEIGKEVNFTFIFRPHKKDNGPYDYDIKFDNELLKTGSFELPPDGSESINSGFIPHESTLEQSSVSNASDFRLGNNIELATIIGNLSHSGKLTIPIDFLGQSMVLIFDPNKNESLTLDNRSLVEVGNPNNIDIPNRKRVLSNYGYMLRQEELQIDNNHGILKIQHRSSYKDYRYAFKIIKVIITKKESDYSLSTYEASVWTIVKEDPENLLS
jgi:hypothetical protein